MVLIFVVLIWLDGEAVTDDTHIESGSVERR